MVQNNNEIDLRRFFRTISRHRMLFASVFIVIVALATLFALTRAPQFTTMSELLIEDSSSDTPQRSSGALGLMMRTFSIGGFGNANVDNELRLMASHDVVMRTVRRLHLNVTCTERRGLTTYRLWDDAPVNLSVPDSMGYLLREEKPLRLIVNLRGRKADIKLTQGGMFGHTLCDKKDVVLPALIETPYGPLTLTPANGVQSDEPTTLKFSITSYEHAADYVAEKVHIETSDKVSDGIYLTIKNNCPAMARAILNTMMEEYNAKRIERKHATARNEVEFLNNRIDLIFSSISDTEKKIEQYKTDSRFVDIEKEAPILLENSLEAHETLLRAKAEVVYGEQVLATLDSNPTSLLPAYTTPGGDAEGNPMVKAYNEQLMTLTELRRSAMPGNHALQVAEERIAEMRKAVVASINQSLVSARKIINERSGIVGRMDAQLERLPQYEREYISLSRDQLLQNELYAILVEKRESALLNYHSDSSLGFIFDPAFTELRPSPLKPLIYIILGIIAAMGACTLIALRFMRRNDTVDQPLDLHFCGLEQNAMMFNPADKNDADRLRTKVRTVSVRSSVFIARLTDGCDAAEETIIDSLRRAKLIIDDILTPTSTDEILSPQFNQVLAYAASGYEYVVVKIPDGTSIDEITPAIDDNDPVVILLLKASTISRPEFKSLVSNLNPDRTLVAIIA